MLMLVERERRAREMSVVNIEHSLVDTPNDGLRIRREPVD
jgi:hypothetical protein